MRAEWKQLCTLSIIYAGPIGKTDTQFGLPDDYIILLDDQPSSYRLELIKLLPELDTYKFIGLRNKMCVANNHIRLSKPPAKLIKSKYLVDSLIDVWSDQKINGSRIELPKRFYIERKTSGNGSNNRKIVNIDDRDIFLNQHDIALLHMEDLSVEDEILLFREAEIVIGVEGAAFVNAIHMRSGSKLIELHHKTRSDELWAEICHKRNINHIRLECATPFTPEHEESLKLRGIKDFMMPLVCNFDKVSELIYG